MKTQLQQISDVPFKAVRLVVIDINATIKLFFFHQAFFESRGAMVAAAAAVSCALPCGRRSRGRGRGRRGRTGSNKCCRASSRCCRRHNIVFMDGSHCTPFPSIVPWPHAIQNIADLKKIKRSFGHAPRYHFLDGRWYFTGR